MIQGGEDAQDTLSCRSFSAKRPLIIGLFCGKRPTKIKHLKGLRHPVPCSSGSAMRERDSSSWWVFRQNT